MSEKGKGKEKALECFQPDCGLGAKYTCPACGIRSCLWAQHYPFHIQSAAHSSLHKTLTDPPCSGSRNPASYVPMNQYSYGTMVSDYVFLEEMQRTIGDVQNTSQKAGKATPGLGSTNEQKLKKKLDLLKRELNKLSIGIEFLPAGMERRRKNETRWNPKTQQPVFTVSVTTPAVSTPYLIHNLPGSFRLSALFAAPYGKKLFPPTTLQSPSQNASNSITLIPPIIEEPSPLPSYAFLLPFHPLEKNHYHLLATLPSSGSTEPTLFSVLEGKSFLEYPSIQVHTLEELEAMTAAGAVIDKGKVMRVWGQKRELVPEEKDKEGGLENQPHDKRQRLEEPDESEVEEDKLEEGEVVEESDEERETVTPAISHPEQGSVTLGGGIGGIGLMCLDYLSDDESAEEIEL